MLDDMINLSRLLRATAAAMPHKPAIVQDDVTITYEEFDLRVNKLAWYLRRDSGLGSGDRVAYLFQNQWEVLVAYHAITRIGAVVVSVNNRLTPAEIDWQLAQSAATVLIYDASFAATVSTVAQSAKSVKDFIVANGDGGPARVSFADIMAGPDRAGPDAGIVVKASDDSGIWFTSGTTGNPKGAVVRHSSSIWAATATALAIGINADSRLLSVAPLFHRGAMEDMHLAVTLVGGTQYLMPRFDPVGVLERMQRHRISHAFIVPTMSRMMVDVSHSAGFDLSNLRCWMSASAPLRKELADVVRGTYRLGEGVLINVYGITESLINTVCQGAELIERPESIGRAVPGVQLRVLRADGSFAANGETGEIVTSGPANFRTYLNNEEAFRAATFERDGVYWYRSGDVGRRDEDGFFYIVDRSKDMIISGGENVYCVEVENAIFNNSSVQEVAVVGSRDEKWGEKVVAVVVPKPGSCLSEQEILSNCKDLAKYKWPREILFWDSLPKNSFGKVQKSEIRKLLA